MLKINLLDEKLINKIAAGEVIERPANVVKELVENALDAGATKISIEIKNSGQELIKIADNGEGMEEEDAKNSIIRHATSKIKDTDDLFNINTLGFRGEALASIAAVSQMSLTTKQKDQIEGFNIAIEGGQIISSGIMAAEQGTVVEVRNLFFNTPARKKFLKTDAVELRHIVEVIIRYALINPQINFKLTHDGHELLNSPAVEDWRSNIAAIYGLKLAKELLEVDYCNEENNIRVKGYIVKPYQARNDKNQQDFFVNKRWVKNDGVNRAIYEAYHSLLFVNKHPIFILNLEVDPQEIDVNVHPTKQEIKFEQKNTVQNAVFTAIKETLQKNNLIPILDFETEQQLSFGAQVKKKEGSTNLEKNKHKKEQSKYAFETSEQKTFEVEEKNKEIINYQELNYPESEENKENKENISDDESYFTPENEVFVGHNIKENVLKNGADLENVKLPSMRILGQIHRTFFVAETPGGMLLIDQHVVQERVLYERFMEQFLNKNVAVQNLLKNEVLDFSPAEKISILENKEKLAELGFHLEEFGENTFVLKAVPTLFGRIQPQKMIYEVLSHLEDGKNKLAEVQEEIITRMACRASVKAGDVITIPQIEKLLQELAQTKLPYTCPHGRAVLIKIAVDEMEKKFKRK